MRIRFQAEADPNQIVLLATIRREPAVDFQTAADANLAGLNDVTVLRTAARDGRVLVTHDQKTMPGHFAEFIKTASSPGVILIPQHLPVAVVAEELLVVWNCTEAEEWVNRICFLPL